MIELAPNHKYGLSIEVPVMPASGAFGFGDAYGDLVDVSRLGAVVTNPVSLQPRRSAQGNVLPYTAIRSLSTPAGQTPEPAASSVSTVQPGSDLPCRHRASAGQPCCRGRTGCRALSTVPNVRGIELGYTAGVSRKRHRIHRRDLVGG